MRGLIRSIVVVIGLALGTTATVAVANEGRSPLARLREWQG